MNRMLLNSAALLLAACTRDDPSYLPPTDSGARSTNPIQALFEARCSGSTCHIGATMPGGDLDLSATQAALNLINVASTEDPARLRVKPGQPSQSYLLCKVDPSCSPIIGARMPQGTALSASDISLLSTWISQGATGLPLVDGGVPSTVDQAAPTFVGATSATAAPSSVTVSWNAATDDHTDPTQIAYQIYQATAAGGENFNAPTFTTAPGATSYTASKLAVNTTYYFVVRAQDLAGNVDQNKAEVKATTPANADTQPPAFAGLTSATASGNSVTLTWNAATDNITASNQLVYLIYQATAAGGENYASPTYTTAAGATSYAATGLNANTAYYFVVRAQDAAGNTTTTTLERSATTQGATLSGQVQPIFSKSCTGNGCHAGASPAQGLDLSSASRSYANLVNIASAQCAATKRVLPSAPDQSYLVWKIKGSGTCFFGTRMPKGQQLSAADQNTIMNWIGLGALNN